MSGTGQTLLFGLVGNPVAHSLSPFIMNRAFMQIGIDAIYIGVGVGPELLPATMNGLSSLGAMGINITYPFKEEALYHLDIVASDADLVQAVNTLVFYDDEIHGYNTDAPGTATALEVFTDVPIEQSSVFIYGGGGSARAAAYGLLERGCQRVTFAMRSHKKAEMVIERFNYAFPEQDVTYVVLDDDNHATRRREAFKGAGVVINATPVGMAGVAEGSLIEDKSWIHRDQCFFDFVYHPRHTPFLETARARGARTLGGLALLVSQAAESFRLWTDQTFDVKEMAEAVDKFTQTGSSSEGVN